MANTGIRPRHARSCRSRHGGKCNCKPTYEAWVYDKRAGRKIRKSFRNLSEAKSWRSDAAGEVRRGRLRAATAPTVREAWSRWLTAAERGEARTRGGQTYKPSVLRSYEASMRLRVLDDLGALRLGDVTRLDLRELVSRWLGEGLDPSTIRNSLMPLRCLYRRALGDGLVSVSPLTDLELPAVRGRRERTVTAEEAALLVAAAPEQDRALWACALYAGLRRGELMALQWEDVVLGSGLLHVRQSWDRAAGPVAPKSSAGVRAVPIAGLLRAQLLEQRLRTGRAEGLVFGRSATRPFEPAGVQARADKSWRAHGLERVTLHECRHAFSTFLDAAGVWPTRADRYMGHADHSTPGRYRHQLAEHYATDAELLGRYLTGARAGAQAAESASLSEK